MRVDLASAYKVCAFNTALLYASPLLPGHLEIALRRPEHEVRRPCPPRVKENAWSTHAAVTRVTPDVKS